MKRILIIEDDPIFGEKLKKRLVQIGFIVDWWTKCDSIDMLMNIPKRFDLLLLDLNLGESSLIHGEGILENLKTEFSAIIVMTAHDDLIVHLLKSNVYTVLRKPIDMDLIVHNVRNAITFFQSVTSKIDKNKIDFAIVTAQFEDEFESVKDIFGLEINPSLKLGEKNVYEAYLQNYPQKRVIALYQSELGRTDASNLVTDIIKEYHPRYIFMTGVCGGNIDTNIGDIVVAKFVFTFDKGKITDKDFLREIEVVKIREELIRIIRENNKAVTNESKKSLKDYQKNIKAFQHFDINALRAIIDPMACSSAVIDKPGYFTEVISKVDRKATAVEMESYGFARAAEITNSGTTKFLVIKSVMDKTTGKNDFAKLFASYTSGVYLKTLLEKGILD